MILAEHSKMAKDDPRTSTNTPGEGVLSPAQVKLILFRAWKRTKRTFLVSSRKGQNTARNKLILTQQDRNGTSGTLQNGKGQSKDFN